MIECVAYVIRLYINDTLHSTYRVDTEAEAWDLTTQLRNKFERFGVKVEFTTTEVLRHG